MEFLVEIVASVLIYRIVRGLAFRSSRGGGTVIVGDADRGVFPDIAASEEGIRGEDRVLVHTVQLFYRTASVTLL